MDVSLCILTCGQLVSTRELIESVRAFEGLDVEVVIGDNTRKAEDRQAFSELADTYFPVTDEELWFDGFGPTKQRVVNAASNRWVVIADPGEVWSDVPGGGLELLESDESPVYKTLLYASDASSSNPDEGVQHSRVFDRKRVRLVGLIHEEAYLKRTFKHWSTVAKDQHFARISHSNFDGDSAYHARKNALYENLLHRIHVHPELRTGTNSGWYERSWPERLKQGWDGEMTFEQWQKRFGGDPWE